MKTEIEKLPRTDFRRHRAVAFTAALVESVKDIISPELCGELYRRLFDVLYENGAAWTTEEERQRLGFEPRDDKGWTQSEIEKHQQEILESMHTMRPSLEGQVWLDESSNFDPDGEFK